MEAGEPVKGTQGVAGDEDREWVCLWEREHFFGGSCAP